jgi:hypothetical protein
MSQENVVVRRYFDAIVRSLIGMCSGCRWLGSSPSQHQVGSEHGLPGSFQSRSLRG